ncbi:MAG TPA: DUF4135 domain-containing protein [Herbaspirillum sp.]
MALETANTLLINLHSDGLPENIFDWNEIYTEVLKDFTSIELQADVFYREKQNAEPLIFSSFVSDLILKRAEQLRLFLKKLARAIEEFSKLINATPKVTALRFLEADSHNQGEKPVTFHLAKHGYVLKFRDPRPYQILQHVLRFLQTTLQIELHSPNIWCAPSNEWHVMPFITEDNETCHIESSRFMIRLGAITAVAYFLQMTDLHLDNVIVSKGIPIIIDPECIFYGYDEYSADTIENRLWNTGLVGEDPALSAIRGGSVPIFDFCAKEEQGRITYLRQTSNRYRHRLFDRKGHAVDPVEFEAEIWDGFSKAYEALCKSKNQLGAEIEILALPSMRTRFLLRLTVHYATTIEILRRPTHENDTFRLGKLTSTFLKSGGMSKLIDDKTKRCELHDMLGSDFPFFWTEDIDGSPTLMHWSGNVSKLSDNDSLKNRIKKAITNCSISDLPKLKTSMNKFFLKEI